MNNKQNNPNQLQLNFEESQKNLDKALNDFTDASKKFAASLDGGNPETSTMMDDEVTKTRATIRRIVGVLASQTGLDFHTVWVLAYHEHNKRTGYHAVRDSRGRGTHLDKVAEAGQLDELEETVLGMLTNQKFNRS